VEPNKIYDQIKSEIQFVDFHVMPKEQQKWMYGIARVKVWNKIVLCYKVIKKDDGKIFVAEFATKYGDEWKPNHIIMDSQFNKEVRSEVFQKVRGLIKKEDGDDGELPF